MAPENEDLHPNETPEVKAQRREYVAGKVEQFLASGGTIKTIERGVSGQKDKPGLPSMIYGDAPDYFRL